MITSKDLERIEKRINDNSKKIENLWKKMMDINKSSFFRRLWDILIIHEWNDLLEEVQYLQEENTNLLSRLNTIHVVGGEAYELDDWTVRILSKEK